MNQVKKKKKIFQGRYEILSIVGRGSCSVVYHGRLIDEPEKDVALKVLINKKHITNLSDQLRKEALSLVSARNNHVIGLNDFHSIGDLSYLAMEFAPKADLRTYLENEKIKKLPISQTLKFLEQILEALAFLHKIGMLHRDIKPSNILVMNKKEVKLGDFGVALLPGEKVAIEELQKGIGTMDYMAPEVFEGKIYNESSDVYQLAVTAYELISGTHPFSGKALAEVLNIRKDDKIAPLKEIEESISKVIQKGMSFDYNSRYKNGQEFLEAFKDALNGKVKQENLAKVEETDLEDEIDIDEILENNESEESKLEEKKEDKENLQKEKEDFFAFMEEMQKKIDKKKEEKEKQGDSKKIIENVDQEKKEDSIVNNTEEKKISAPEFEKEEKKDDIDVTEEATPGENQSEGSGSSFLSKALDTTYVEEDINDFDTQTTQNLKNNNEIEIITSNKTPSAKWIKLIFVLIILYVLYLKVLTPIFFSSDSLENSNNTEEVTQDDNSSQTASLPINTSGTQLSFPNINTGTYSGEITNLIPGTSQPITLISEGNGQIITLLVGLKGFDPISIEPKNNEKALVFRTNGFMLEFKGAPNQNTLKGQFTNLINGKTGTWYLKTILNN